MLGSRSPRRERSAAEYVPYAAHVAPGVVKTLAGDYLFGFELPGIPIDAASEEDLNRWHERLNGLWRALATEELAIWTHWVRRPAPPNPLGYAASGFARQFAQARAARRRERPPWELTHLVWLVLRPPRWAEVSVRPWDRWRLRREQDTETQTAQARVAQDAERESLLQCERVALQVSTALAAAQPQRLQLFAPPIGGRASVADTPASWASAPRSGLVDALSGLINGEWLSRPAPRGPLAEQLVTSRLLFGQETVEVRTPTATRLGALLAIKDYPPESAPGMLNRLLDVDFGFVLTQSFTALPRSSALALLHRQRQRFANAGDQAVSQAALLGEAADQLAGGEFALGEHHLNLLVWDELEPVTLDHGARSTTARWRRLQEQVAAARTRLSDAGAVVVREDLALEAGFWAQLPGNFALRPRVAPITSRNFAGLAPLHGVSAGRTHGLHWGEAVLELTTRAHTPYYLSLHAGSAAGGLTDVGHTLILGPSGSGKTVLLGTLAAEFTRFGATQVIFDKDRGLDILVRALGGQYCALQRGLPTGLNPLQWPDSPSQRAFLSQWLRVLVRPGETGDLSARDEAELDAALSGTLALDPASRTLSRLVEFLDPTDLNGLAARLTRWCDGRARGGVEGEVAWVFDQAPDRLAQALRSQTLVGFDVTEFLGVPDLRVPIAMVLFELTQQRIDGRRVVVWFDEFSRLLDDRAFTAFAKDGLKTWRKRNAVAVFATQSASDVLASAIARTLVEQTVTQVLFPTPQAAPEELMQGLGLSLREVALLRQHLSPESRQCLIRQGSDRVVASLSLDGLAGELAVVSGRTESLQRLERCREQWGESPAQWLPPFMAGAGAPANKPPI